MESAAGPSFGVGEPHVRIGCSPSGLLLPIGNAVGIVAAVGLLDNAWLVMPVGWGGWGATVTFGLAGLVYALFGLAQVVVFMMSPIRLYVGGLSEIASNTVKCWALSVASESVGFGVRITGWWTIVLAGIIVAAVRFIFGARTSFDE
ncbi:hypothetical protein AB0L82_34140 [Nocardia sp. NPDC052001]|uniref:hypothetical protein n=1 Tax=Nocardia sp. NPDC052001 TaxID=3154853 RepID=UPI00344814D8